MRMRFMSQPLLQKDDKKEKVSIPMKDVFNLNNFNAFKGKDIFSGNNIPLGKTENGEYLLQYQKNNPKILKDGKDLIVITKKGDEKFNLIFHLDDKKNISEVTRIGGFGEDTIDDLTKLGLLQKKSQEKINSIIKKMYLPPEYDSFRKDSEHISEREEYEQGMRDLR